VGEERERRGSTFDHTEAHVFEQKLREHEADRLAHYHATGTRSGRRQRQRRGGEEGTWHTGEDGDRYATNRRRRLPHVAPLSPRSLSLPLRAPSESSMTARPASEALGVKEHVMAVPKDMMRMAAVTAFVGTWRACRWGRDGWG
jgi:hypothetical protein